MDKEYLTVKDAIAHTGKSEETIRRWIRSIRGQFLIDLGDTNEQLEQKTTFLRKQNEAQPDGAPRQDRHGSPIFDWLLLREALDESFPATEGQAPLTIRSSLARVRQSILNPKMALRMWV